MVTYHEHGGYSMDSSEIGVVLTVVAICQLIWQVRFTTHDKNVTMEFSGWCSFHLSAYTLIAAQFVLPTHKMLWISMDIQIGNVDVCSHVCVTAILQPNHWTCASTHTPKPYLIRQWVWRWIWKWAWYWVAERH